MQDVVSNSSPLIHLAKIGKLNLLHEFFGVIAVPRAVYEECVVRPYKEVHAIKNAEWLKVFSVTGLYLVKLLESELDKGESEAIALALERNADLLLLDDADARQKARIYNIEITGTLGILLRAKKENKIESFSQITDELMATGFRIDAKLRNKLLAEAGELRG